MLELSLVIIIISLLITIVCITYILLKAFKIMVHDYEFALTTKMNNEEMKKQIEFKNKQIDSRDKLLEWYVKEVDTLKAFKSEVDKRLFNNYTNSNTKVESLKELSRNWR